MHFGTQSLTGQDIALSFADGKFIDFVFMDGFIKCITEDDLIVRPDCHGYRIFLEPLVSVCPYIFKLFISLFYLLLQYYIMPVVHTGYSKVRVHQY